MTDHEKSATEDSAKEEKSDKAKSSKVTPKSDKTSFKNSKPTTKSGETVKKNTKPKSAKTKKNEKSPELSRLMEIGLGSPERIEKMLDDPELAPKLRFDIEKWLTELAYVKLGKAENEEDGKPSELVIRFEGELEEFSR